MRALGMGIVLAALAGCATAGTAPEAAAPTAAAPDQVIACVPEELEQMGYEVTTLNVDPAEGQVTGVRVEDPAWPLQLIGFRSTVDRIAVFVGPDELRVTALAAEDVPEAGVVGTGRMTASQRQAEQVVAACAR
jgi:hypothetical protein